VVGDHQGPRQAVDGWQVAALALEHGGQLADLAGIARPVSAWVAAMYSKTRAVASSPRPAANALTTSDFSSQVGIIPRSA
jgi:hypothetical protein